MTDNSLKNALSGRRQAVFGASALMAGFSIASLCFCPLLLTHAMPAMLFYSQQQETFFFGLFGFMSASWLLCWVSELNGWHQCSKMAQWSGLLFLCVDQVNLLAVWRAIADTGIMMNGLWIAPAIIQVYLIGSFFGFFTLPGLTRDGNRTLTGLGTLALLLPWLIGRNEIVAGTQCLTGLFLK